MFLSRIAITLVACAALCGIAAAATTATIVAPSTATWKPMPGFGSWQMAPIVGNPATAGAYYAYFLKVPAGGKVAPHFHRNTETVVVISGTLLVGIGDKMDVATMKALGPGSVASIPAGLHHYAMAKDAVVIELSGIGPDSTTFIK